MRVPVYRNLDSPFQIGGFKPYELVIVSALFVILSEISSSLGINRVWAFLFALVLGASLYWMRRSLGDEFPKRIVRFLMLPTQLYARPFWMRRSR